MEFLSPARIGLRTCSLLEPSKMMPCRANPQENPRHWGCQGFSGGSYVKEVSLKALAN